MLNNPTPYTPEELTEALRAVNSMIHKCEKALEKFPEGNSHHTLLQGRLKAMYISKALITDKLAEIASASKPVELKSEECSPEVLVSHLDLLHTTDLGAERIKKNLDLRTDDIIAWCKEQIQAVNAVITHKGKNWYITIDGVVITVNAHSYTVITAHLK